MTEPAPIPFPSEKWVRELNRRLAQDAGVQAAMKEFGAFTGGAVLEKGAGLQSDLCFFIEAKPGAEPLLTFCEDEDELDDLGPAYLLRAPHGLVRDLLRAVLKGEMPDGLKLLTSGQMKLKGDLARIVRLSGRHPHAGLPILRSMPTQFLDPV